MIAICVIGIMLMILGVFPLLAGIFNNSGASEQYAEYVEKASDNTGLILIIIGAVIMIIGLALVVFSMHKKPSDTYSSFIGLILTILGGAVCVLCFVICTFKINLLFYLIAITGAYLLLTGVIINTTCAIKNKIKA